jgi:hypothetical protein
MSHEVSTYNNFLEDPSLHQIAIKQQSCICPIAVTCIKLLVPDIKKDKDKDKDKEKDKDKDKDKDKGKDKGKGKVKVKVKGRDKDTQITHHRLGKRPHSFSSAKNVNRTTVQPKSQLLVRCNHGGDRATMIVKP